MYPCWTLAGRLLERFERLKQGSDFEEAIRISEDVLDLKQQDSSAKIVAEIVCMLQNRRFGHFRNKTNILTKRSDSAVRDCFWYHEVVSIREC